MEKSYAVAYKCILCGELFEYGEPFSMPYESLPEFCGKVVQNQLFAGNPYLHKAPMQLVHKCKNGGCGMAYFAGVLPVK